MHIFDVFTTSCSDCTKPTLAWQDRPFEKTHSLVALVGMCLEFDSDFDTLRNTATTLTPFAVTIRYPGDMPDISAKEAREALNLARQIWDFVLIHLPKETQIL
jgi:hypothetical protein